MSWKVTIWYKWYKKYGSTDQNAEEACSRINRCWGLGTRGIYNCRTCGGRQHSRQNIIIIIIIRFCVLYNVYWQQTRETIVIIVKIRTWKAPSTLELSETVSNAILFLAVFISFLFIFILLLPVIWLAKRRVHNI